MANFFSISTLKIQQTFIIASIPYAQDFIVS